MDKGCGKPISDIDNFSCGSWWGGDQHFCKKCFDKFYQKSGARCKRSRGERQMKIYKCNKCGQESEMIPKKHGFFQDVYNITGKQAKHIECSGEFILIKQDVKGVENE